MCEIKLRWGGQYCSSLISWLKRGQHTSPQQVMSVNGQRHYAKYRQRYLDKNKQNRKVKKEFVNSFKVGKPCYDCGNFYPPYVLDFHHTRDKKYNVANMYVKVSSLETIKKEIEKCVLLCANCHRVRTNGESAKGRQADFESVNLGSIPSSPAQ